MIIKTTNPFYSTHTNTSFFAFSWLLRLEVFVTPTVQRPQVTIRILDVVCTTVATVGALSTGVPTKARWVGLVARNLGLGHGRDLPYEDLLLGDSVGHLTVSQHLEYALLF